MGGTLIDRTDRLRGLMLGLALGDALGLPAEGMSAARIARRFGRMDRFRLLGGTGFVSDDTELAALTAHALLRHPVDPDACARELRRLILAWLGRLPWGMGMATVMAGLRMAMRWRRSGVASAGNGAVPRAAVVGGFFADDAMRRQTFAVALTEPTHTDRRAIEASLFTAELAAAAVNGDPTGRQACFDVARAVVTDRQLGGALDVARRLAATAAVDEAAATLGTSGFVVHAVPFAAWGFLAAGGEPVDAIVSVAGAGGDTDSNASTVGAWLGALGGESALPADLVGRIHDGPFGPRHLRGLADALAGGGHEPPWSAVHALLRNLTLWPVILAHGFRRLLP